MGQSSQVLTNWWLFWGFFLTPQLNSKITAAISWKSSLKQGRYDNKCWLAFYFQVSVCPHCYLWHRCLQNNAPHRLRSCVKRGGDYHQNVRSARWTVPAEMQQNMDTVFVIDRHWTHFTWESEHRPQRWKKKDGVENTTQGVQILTEQGVQNQSFWNGSSGQGGNAKIWWLIQAHKRFP